MGYTLAAFIGTTVHLEQKASKIAGAKLIQLSQGFAIIPLSDEFTQPLEPSVTAEPFYHLSDALFKLGVDLSSNSAVGFFEIELFGGYGERNAILWQNQTVVFGPAISVDDSAVTNQLFSLLGVKKLNFYDEFDALGLGRYRSNEDWIANS